MTSNNLTSVEQDLDDLVRPGESTVISTTLIPDYEYFLSDLQYHNNSEGSCTTVAGQILLAYNNWANDGRLITDTNFLYNYNPSSADYLANYNKPYAPERTSTSEAFFNYLYVETGPSASFGKLYDSIQNYLNNKVELNVAIGVFKGVINGRLLAVNKIKDTINGNNPCIASIEYLETQGGESEKIDHAVVVYGYQSIALNGYNRNGFIANFGWFGKKGYDYVWFDEEWVTGCFYFYTAHRHNDSMFNDIEHIYRCDVCNRIKSNNEHVYNERIKVPGNIVLDYYKQDFHYKVCDCGHKEFEEHIFARREENIFASTGQVDGENHKAFCWVCGEVVLEKHYFKYNSCYYCGFY